MANDNSQEVSDSSAGAGAVTDATVVVRFAIGEALRFLSHAETMRLWERACVRAHVPVKYTQGFNPHAKLSLPLPRAVGVASADERLVVRLFKGQGFPLGAEQEALRRIWQRDTQAALAEELVAGMIVHEAALMKSRVSFHPVSAQYVFALSEIEGLEEKIAGIMAQESLVVDRASPSRPRGRRVDVRPFLTSIRLDAMQTIVECGISDAGSIRVDEIMALLQIAPTELTAPIRRVNIAWKIT